MAWFLVLIAGSAAVKPGVDFEEPLMMIFGPVLYVILANIAYTAGPIFDTVVYRGSPRKKLFKRMFTPDEQAFHGLSRCWYRDFPP